MFPQDKQNTFFQERHITKFQIEVKSSHLLDYLVKTIIGVSRKRGFIIDSADESFCNPRQVTTSLPAAPNINWRKIKENQYPSPRFVFAKCFKVFRWKVVGKWKPSHIGKYFHCCWFTASCKRKATIWHHHFEERERSNAAWTKKGFVLFC